MTVWNWVQKNVLIEENLIEGLKRRESQNADERARLEEQKAYYEQRLVSIDEEIERLKTLYTSGLFKLEQISKDKRRLDLNRIEVEQQKTEVVQRLAGLGISPDTTQSLLEQVHAIKAKASCLTDTGKREILELLGTTVVLYKVDDNPWCHIEVNLTVQEVDEPIMSQDSSAPSVAPRVEFQQVVKRFQRTIQTLRTSICVRIAYG